MEDRGDWFQETRRMKETYLENICVEKKNNRELEEESDEEDEIWRLRKEYESTSKALRKRNSERDSKMSNVCEEETKMEGGKRVVRRPIVMHRNTDPTPMREFTNNLNVCKESDTSDGAIDEQQAQQLTISSTISEETETKSDCVKKSVVHDEQFLMSSYDLAKRRLSLPLSKIEHCWNEGRGSSHELPCTGEETPSNLMKTSHRSSPKSTDHSNMEKRRRQSAWTRRPSAYTNDEMRRNLGKRRMSELPALSSLATRRRTAPHTISVPVGLKRRGSRSGNSLDYQTNKSASARAKNEMLATLSMSSWASDIDHFQETGRRKSFNTGFGAMALKKKEEKRLMVAHEILQTEKNYIKALETLNEVFVEPFRNACVIPEKDIRIIFPKQLQMIKDGHVRFMKELEERLNNWKWQEVLGDIFAKLCNSYHIDFMSVYTEYVANFPKSVAIINKYSRNSQKFRKLIEKCTIDPRCERLNLSAFLLTPIQRLPRYVLLLRQLSKYTDPNHPDSFHIEISLEKMISIINLLNSSIQNSTRVARNTSIRHTSRRRRKKHIFKPKESNSDLTSPRKSSDESDSGQSTPCAKNLSLELSPADQQNKSSDCGSLSNSEATPEATSAPASPCQPSGSSKGNFLKVILRNNSDPKKNKRRPLSTTEVEIFRRKEEEDLTEYKPAELKRSASRESLGSIIRHKFGSFRRKHRGSEESLSRNRSYERLDNDCKITLFRNHSDACYERLYEGGKTRRLVNDNPKQHFLSVSLHSGSSVESCNGSREYLPVPRAHGHSDSEESTPTSPGNSRPTSRQDFIGNDYSLMEKNDNCDDTKACLDTHKTPVIFRDNEGHNRTDEKARRKLAKRNSFTDVVKHFFVSKSRSNSPEMLKYSQTPSQNSKTSKEKITTV